MKVIRIAFVHISYMHASEFFYEKYHNLEKKAVYKLVTWQIKASISQSFMNF